MKKVKEFIANNKKIIIPVVVALVLLVAVGVCFVLRPSGGTGEVAEKQTEETTKTSQEETKTEDTEEDGKKDGSQETKKEGASSTTPATGSGSSHTSSSSHTSGSTGNSSSAGVSSGGTSKTSHTHVWLDHTAKKWTENIVTVVDQPERYEEYTLYRMYWYNTGSWEETRDPSRFRVWQSDRDGGPLSPNSITMAKRPEDCPLFTGYDDLGHATYTGDHAIISGLYDKIPAVTHEEDQGYYETYVDYQYCRCGARKQP